jgi:CheY-like chemotaxis protein
MSEIDEELGSAEESTAKGPRALAIEKSRRIERFAARVVGEALRLGADSLSLAMDRDRLCGALLRGGAEVKTISVAGRWFEPLYLWLRERRAAYLSADPEAALAAPAAGESDAIYTGAVRVDDGELATFNVRRKLTLNKKHTLTLSQFARFPHSRVTEQLGFSKQHRAAFERLASGGEGIIVLASPTEAMLEASVAATLALTGAHLGGPADGPGTSAEEWSALAAGTLVALTVCADDLVEVVHRLFNAKLGLDQLPVRALLCQGFAAQVCGACARDSAIEAKLIEELPPVLRKFLGANYSVGRGCDTCGQRGYRGRTLVASVLEVTPHAARDIAACAPGNSDALAAALLRADTVPLLVDGVQKLASGAITFQSLYKLTRGISASWIKALEARRDSARGADDPLEVDLYHPTPEKSRPMKLSGRAAFTGNPADDPGDQPVISGLKRRRERPLVLVVEDDPDQRSILEMVFKSAEYDVALAGDGVEALERVKREGPDLIVTDLMMPKMDGSQLVKQLKSDPDHREIPVLVLTVLSDSNKEYSLLDLGAEDYCEKTIQRKILLKRAENLLRRAS